MDKRQKKVKRHTNSVANLFSSSSSDDVGLSSGRSHPVPPRVRRLQARRTCASDFKLKNPLTNVKRVPGPLPQVTAESTTPEVTELRTGIETSSDSDFVAVSRSNGGNEQIQAESRSISLHSTTIESRINVALRNAASLNSSSKILRQPQSQSHFIKDSSVVKLPPIHPNPTSSFVVATAQVESESNNQPHHSKSKNTSPTTLIEDLEQRRKRTEVLEECFGHSSNSNEAQYASSRHLPARKPTKSIRFCDDNSFLDECEEWKPETHDSASFDTDTLEELPNVESTGSLDTSQGYTTTTTLAPVTTSDSRKTLPEVESLYMSTASENEHSSDSAGHQHQGNEDSKPSVSASLLKFGLNNVQNLRGPSPNHLPRAMALAMAEHEHPTPRSSSKVLARPDSVELSKKRISMPQSKVIPQADHDVDPIPKALKSLQIGASAATKPIQEPQGKNLSAFNTAADLAPTKKKPAASYVVHGQIMDVETDPEEPPGIPHYLIRSSLSTSSLDDPTDYTILDFPHNQSSKRKKNKVDLLKRDPDPEEEASRIVESGTKSVVNDHITEVNSFPSKGSIASDVSFSSIPGQKSTTLIDGKKLESLSGSKSSLLDKNTKAAKNETKIEAKSAAVKTKVSTLKVPVQAPIIIPPLSTEKISLSLPIPPILTNRGPSNKSMSVLNKIPLRSAQSNVTQPQKVKVTKSPGSIESKSSLYKSSGKDARVRTSVGKTNIADFVKIISPKVIEWLEGNEAGRLSSSNARARTATPPPETKKVKSKPSTPKVYGAKKPSPRAMPMPTPPRKSKENLSKTGLLNKISTAGVAHRKKSILKISLDPNEPVTAHYFSKLGHLGQPEKPKVVDIPAKSTARIPPIVRPHVLRRSAQFQASTARIIGLKDKEPDSRPDEGTFKSAIAKFVDIKRSPKSVATMTTLFPVQSKVPSFQKPSIPLIPRKPLRLPSAQKSSRPSSTKKKSKDAQLIATGSVLYPDRMAELRTIIAKRHLASPGRLLAQTLKESVMAEDNITYPRNRIAEAKRRSMEKRINTKNVQPVGVRSSDKLKDRVLCRKPFKLTLSQLLEAIDKRKKVKGQAQGQGGIMDKNSNVQQSNSKIMDIKSLLRNAHKSGEWGAKETLSEILNKNPNLVKAVESVLQDNSVAPDHPHHPRVPTPRKMGLAAVPGPKVPNYLKPVDRNPKNHPGPAAAPTKQSRPKVAHENSGASDHTKDKDKPVAANRTKLMPNYLIFGRFPGLRERIAGKRSSSQHPNVLPTRSHLSILAISQTQNVNSKNNSNLKGKD